MGSPQKNGAYCHTQPSPPPSSKIEHEDPPYLFTPPKLWLIDNYITNYVVWRTHVHDQFRRDGLLGFIDGTMIPPPKTVLRNLDDDGEGVLMENLDYHRWREEFDKPVKERLLSLLDKDIVPIDHHHKTCTDIWMDLRERFRPLASRLEEEGLEGVYQAALALKYLSAAPQLAGLKVSNKSALTCLASNQVMFGHQNTKNMEYVFPRVTFLIITVFHDVPDDLNFLRDCFLLCIIGLITFISCCIPLIIINILYWPPRKFLQILGCVEKKRKNQARDDYDIQLIDSLCDSMHMAVESRDQDMFAILYKELRGDNFMRLPLHIPDSHGNNILHLTAKLSPQVVLDKIPGPVLQIQHELKWFKEIEKIIRPHYQVRLNHDGKTPQIIFTEEHKELKDKADKWIKDTSTPCTIIAALISIIMLATALTIPGGSDQHAGFPIITRNAIFTLFVVSDAISFITSVISLLMFMDIMMSHYKVGDFMRHLRIRLFIGLGSLFVAIFFMMLSFSAVVYLVFGQQRRWVLILVVTVTSYVVLLFGYLQGSVLLEMIIGSTYSGNFIPDPQRNNLPRQNHQDNPSVHPLDIL